MQIVRFQLADIGKDFLTLIFYWRNLPYIIDFAEFSQ